MDSSTYFTGKCKSCGYGVITQLDWDRYVPDVLDTGNNGNCYLFYCTNKKCEKHKGEYVAKLPDWVETSKNKSLFTKNAYFIIEMDDNGTILHVNRPFDSKQELAEAIEIGQAQHLFNPNNIYKTAKINDLPEKKSREVKECKIHELGILPSNSAKNELLETESTETDQK